MFSTAPSVRIARPAGAVLLLLPLLAAFLGGCCCVPEEDVPAVYVVEVGSERFRIRLDDPRTVDEAEAHLHSGRSGVVSGELLAGSGGFNEPWDWHLEPGSVEFPDAAIELCDGLPSHVQGALQYWLQRVGQYCPWSARLIERAGP